MKNKIFWAVAIVLGLTACSDNYFDIKPSGGVLTESQFATLDNTVGNSILGIYSSMYAYGGDHDLFGQRSIDLKTDILSGDIAVTNTTYGWFELDDNMNTVENTSGYLWSYYFEIIHNANTILHSIALTSDVTKKVAEYGMPSEENKEYFNAQDSIDAGYYAEAVSMRSYAYLGLVKHFTEDYQDMADPTQRLCAPIYDENNGLAMEPQGLSTAEETFEKVESDLETAIDYFLKFDCKSQSKLRVGIQVARGLLAHTYLYHNDYENALRVAEDVINSHEYTIIPNGNLLTTGFCSIEDPSWMWGQDVNIETRTGLASFFGQVDIHTYSYAQAGDVKAIDEILLNSIPSWDGRQRWFITQKDHKYYGAPHRKFYNLTSGNTTNEEEVDRDWLNDNIFMRIESIYLIAAESAIQQTAPDFDKSKTYLTAITDQRIDTASTAAAEYVAYKANLSEANILKEIEYNWRVEMWGEGYGLQTFRRLTKNKKRGGNHYYYGGEDVKSVDNHFTFRRPSSEDNYNPYIK